ncbi:hypothetical protein PG991_014352 [Apiospora marii]|uniref:Uncharacterized protein n=1 Tax=Apiospora marii TaxID=335849 RepID=A0ABR1R9J8_9PEZI
MEKAQHLDEHAITEIEWIQSNYQKMAGKWIESEKQKLALQRRVQDLEAQQKPSSSSAETGRELRQYRASQRARKYRRLDRRSPSPNDILPSTENDGGYDTRSSSVESGSDGYQGDSEAAPRRLKLRPQPVSRTQGRKPRALSPKMLASLSRARARHRSAQWVRRQQKEEQRRRKRGKRSSPIHISDYSSDTSAASSQRSIPATVFSAPRPSSHRPVQRRSRSPNIERLPAEAARKILPRMFIPSRDGLAFLWEAISIAQHCFYAAALERWPDWTEAQFPQGAHELSFGTKDLEGYFDGYLIGEELALRDASSREVYAAVSAMANLRNRTCHFPPRSDAHYLRMARSRRKRRETGAAYEIRDAIDGLVADAWAAQPDSAGWYRDAMAPACNLASVLNDEGAMAALDDLYDRVENRAWEMLRAVEEIAAFRDDGRQPRGGHEERRREMDQSMMRDMMRALPEELHAPLRMFIETVKAEDLGWPEMIRRAAVVWRETRG